MNRIPAGLVVTLFALLSIPLVNTADAASDDRGRILPSMDEVLRFVAEGSGGTPPKAGISSPVSIPMPLPDEGEPADGFGSAVDVDGDWLAVGAPAHDAGARNAGAVFLFTRNGDSWLFHDRLISDQPAEGAEFGVSLDLAGDLLIVGAPGVDGAGFRSGAATIFRRVDEVWRFEQTMTRADAAESEAFGTAVVVVDDAVLVGAPGAEIEGTPAGAVVEYRASGGIWSEAGLLTAQTPEFGGRFGEALAHDQGRLVVGSPRSRASGETDGAAFVHAVDGGEWVLEEILVPDAVSIGSRFGESAAISGTRIAIGAPRADAGEEDDNSGMVTVFEFAGGDWQASATLLPPGEAPGRLMGHRVAIVDDLVLAGVDQQDDGIVGAAELFSAASGDWVRVATLMAPAGGDPVVSSVAIDGRKPLVGVVPKPGSRRGIGAVLGFEDDTGDWGQVFGLVGRTSGAESLFGFKVASDGDLLVVGAPGAGHTAVHAAGEAHVFRRQSEGWVHEARLRMDAPGLADQFGVDVDVSGDRVIVGAWLDDAGAADSGSASVFAHGASGWELEAKLLSGDPSRDLYFGRGVAIEGDLAAVVAASGGQVSLFRKGGQGWVLDERLELHGEPAASFFYGVVEISDGRVLVGGRYAPEGPRAHVVSDESGSWSIRTIAPDAPDASFGESVAIRGETVAIGAPETDDGIDGAGAVHLFTLDQGEWTASSQVSWDGEDSERPLLGLAVGFLADGTLVVGAPGSDRAAADAGEAWLVDVDSDPVFLDRLSPPGGTAGGFFGSAIDASDTDLAIGAYLTPGEEGALSVGTVATYEFDDVPPDASFVWSPPSPAMGETIVFTDTSGGMPTQWMWNFGDGAVSTAPSPSHVYAAGGNYQVSLTVANDFGSDTATRIVTVDGPPAARFFWEPAFPAAGETVTFVDNSEGQILTRVWDFGDGGSADTPQAGHVFDDPGEYMVNLTVGNDGGLSVAEYAVTVGPSTPPETASNIPAVARVQGSGAFFTSRIDLYNAGLQALDVTVVYTPRSDISGASRRTVVTLPPGVYGEVVDPLGEWFGFTDDEVAVGTLQLTVPEGRDADLLAQSVVIASNDNGTAYGQFFPATPSTAAIEAEEVAYLHTTVDATRNRVNLGLMGLVDGTEVRVAPVDPPGTPLADPRTIRLSERSSTQINDLNQGRNGFDLGERSDYLVRVEVMAGRAIAYVSVLDGTSGTPGTSDPTTLQPVVTGAARVTLLELGPIQGFNDFSGSASLTNLNTTTPEVVTASFFLRDTPGVTAVAELEFGPGETRGWSDFVGEVFGLSGVGTVVLEGSEGAQLYASGREFALFRDDDVITGTAGQVIPGMTDDELLPAGEVANFIGLRQLQQEGGIERSHIAVFNPGDQRTVVTITIVDGATGVVEGSRTLNVAGQELVQRNSVIEWITGVADGAVKRAEVTADQPVFVRAFRVNQDGDPVTIEPLPSP
jgi:PKD repeat protein